MVAGHVIGMTGKGMKVEPDSLWSYFNFAFFYIRMPLFTVISGYVYSLRPVQPENWREFLGKKISRLIVPLVFVGTIQYLFQCLIPDVSVPRKIEGIWRIYLFSYTHFWFLQALLIVFVLIILIDRYRWFDGFFTWGIGLLLASILFLLPIGIKFFSVNEVPYLLPFFFLGYGLSKFTGGRIRNTPAVAMLVFVFASTYALQQLTWFVDIGIHNGRNSLISLLVGLTGTTLLLLGRKEIKWLAYIGRFSFSVYLWHVFATAGSRIILNNFLAGKTNLVLTFSVGLACGIALPICFEKLIVRSRVLGFLCLGKRLQGRQETILDA